MPDQPGVYLALRVEPNEMITAGGEDLSETRSTSSYASTLQNMAANYKNLALKKHVFAADCFLDIEKLPRKTQ